MAKPSITPEARRLDKGLQVRNVIFDCLDEGVSRELALVRAQQIEGVRLHMEPDDWMQATFHYRDICSGVRRTLMRIQRESKS